MFALAFEFFFVVIVEFFVYMILYSIGAVTIRMVSFNYFKPPWFYFKKQIKGDETDWLFICAPVGFFSLALIVLFTIGSINIS